MEVIEALVSAYRRALELYDLADTRLAAARAEVQRLSVERDEAKQQVFAQQEALLRAATGDGGETLNRVWH